jgi:hypothetical protein
MLGLELRRGPWWLAGVAAAVVTWRVSASMQQLGVTLWPEASRGVAYALVLLGPAAGALGSWAGGRDEQFGLHHLTAGGPRTPLTRHWTLLVAVSLPLMLGYLLGAIPNLLHASRQATWGGPDIPLMLVGLVAIPAYVALGYVVGRLGRRWLTAPLVALGIYFGQYLLIVKSGPAQLLVPFPTGQLTPWLLPPHEVAMSAVVWWTFVAVASIAALKVVVTTSRRGRSIAVGALTFAMAAATWAASGVMRHEAWAAEGHSTAEPVCDVSGLPTVCVHPAYRALLPETVELVRPVLAPLEGIPGSPLLVEQAPFGMNLLEAGRAPFSYPVVDGVVTPGPNLAFEVASMALTGPCVLDIPVGYAAYDVETYPAASAVATWLMRNAGLEPPVFMVPKVDRAARRLAQLDDRTRRAWLDDNLRRLQSCAVELSDLP